MPDLSLDTLDSPRFRKLRVDGNVTITIDGDLLIVGSSPRLSVQATAPVSPAVNDLWVDSSITPTTLQRWTGSAWV